MHIEIMQRGAGNGVNAATGNGAGLKPGEEKIKMKKSYVLIDAVMGSVWEDEMMAKSMQEAIEEAKYLWLHMHTPQERENREEFAVCKMSKDDGEWDYDSMTNYHDIIKLCGRRETEG